MEDVKDTMATLARSGADSVAKFADRFADRFGGDSADEDGPMEGGAPTKGKKGAVERKGSHYHILAVVQPSKNVDVGKFYGTCPSQAAAKAGRRVFKQTGLREFSLIMRRVDPSVFKRQLYKYRVEIRKMEAPTGVFTARVAGEFKRSDGKVERDADKRVRIVKKSAAPVYGHVGNNGTIVKGAGDGPAVHRDPKKDTLVLVVPGAIPTTVRGAKVQITDIEPKAVRVEPTPDEIAKYDVSEGFGAAAAARAAKKAKGPAKPKKAAGAAKPKKAAAKPKKPAAAKK